MWEEFWVNSLKCLFCYQSSGAFSFKSSVNFFHLIFSKPKTKEQIWKGNVIHELILQTKNYSCNNSMVYCSWHYSRLAIKNLTPWLHKVDPNFLAGICGVIPILRLQALENRNLIIRDMVVESWNRQFGRETMHPTKKNTSMNLLRLSCVIT